MAISVMKRVVILAEQADKVRLIETLQELKEIEIVPFVNDAEELDQDVFFDGATLGGEASKVNHYKLTSIEDAIEFLKQYVSQLPFLKRMTQKRSSYTLAELEDAVQSMDLDGMLQMVKDQQSELSQIKRKLEQIEEDETFLRKWTSLDYLPKTTEKFNYFTMTTGSIKTEEANELIDQIHEVSEEVLVQELFYSEDISNYKIVYDNEYSEELDDLLRHSDFQVLDYPFESLPKDELAQILDKRKQLVDEQTALFKDLKAEQEILTNFEIAEEYFANLIERDKASQLMMNSNHLFLLKGWMEEDKLSDSMAELEQEIGSENMAIFSYDVDLEADNLDEVPVKLKNNAFNQPFESLTLQYGTPKYNSIDPTPFYSLFQVLFFGIMSADLGYGLLLFIATGIPILFFELKESTKNSLRMFNYMSVGTMLVGMFFGSFFGTELPFGVMNLNVQVIEVMIISVALGFIHMLVGYGLKLYLTIKDKDYASMYLDSLQWILILVGAAIMAVNLILNIPILNTIGLVLVIGNVIGMFIVNMISSKNPLVGFGKGLFGLIDVAGLVGDVVSYTRLTALAVAGANIAMAFNLIVGILPPFARFTIGILLFIGLHALNIFITYLGAYVHSMRLQFVEFFGKFYETGGKEFKPLKPQEKNINIQKNYHN